METSKTSSLQILAAARANQILHAADAVAQRSAPPPARPAPGAPPVARVPGDAPVAPPKAVEPAPSTIAKQVQPSAIPIPKKLPVGTPTIIISKRPPPSASVGCGSSRSEGEKPAFVPQVARPAPAATIGIGAGHKVVPSPVQATVEKPSGTPVSRPVPRVMAPAKHVIKGG